MALESTLQHTAPLLACLRYLQTIALSMIELYVLIAQECGIGRTTIPTQSIWEEG